LGGLNWRIAALLKPFNTPARSLGNLDAEVAAKLIAVASDLALVIDEHGVILDVSFQTDEFARDLDHQSAWLGRPWIDTVSLDSRPKVQSLLREAASRLAPRWRHLNHPSGRGTQVPILYSAVRLGQDPRTVAFGRDLRALSELQQRLVDAQQSLEQDYSRLRHVEMRYRLLFQRSSEAVLILDAVTLKVTEANPAAHHLFGPAIKRVLTRGLWQAFDEAGAHAVHALLTVVGAAGQADEVRARLQEPELNVVVSASLFREDNASLFLVRLAPDEPDDGAALPSPTGAKLLKLVESAPDGFVVIGTDHRIITANAAFLQLAQLGNEEQARGETLDRWLGQQGVELDVLVATLQQRGSVRLFATVVRGENGASTEVEVSAVAVMNGGQPCYGFVARDISRRFAVKPGAQDPRSAEHLTELIGQVSLKELVRQSTDVIERLCIETALKMTGDNRASAAEMLGLSRQSFYVKLRRYGLGDLASEGGDLG